MKCGAYLNSEIVQQKPPTSKNDVSYKDMNPAGAYFGVHISLNMFLTYPLMNMY